MTSTALDFRTTPRRVSTTPPRQVATARPGPPVVRLTRRGRLVVLLSVLVALGGFAMRGAPAASTDVVHHTRTTTVVVSPGETVWDIAQQVAPQADTRATVAEIEQLNALPDAGSIRVGQSIVVPAG